MKTHTLWICLAAWIVALPASGQVFGQIYTLNEQLVPFEGETVELACLEYCMELEVERHIYECGPVVAPAPDSGCDLPWIHPMGPTFLPFPDFPTFGCVPDKPELVGYKLHETHDVVRRIVRHKSNCTSVSEDTVLQTIPSIGPIQRECPDENGPWVERRERIRIMGRVPCP